MTLEEEEKMRSVIENEGFDYAYRHYSEFSDIDDPEFHRLRRVYKAAAQALEDYIPEEIEDDTEDDEDEDDGA